AGLADGLSGDDADCFTELDHPASREIAAIAEDADAALGLTGEHRADLHLLDADVIQGRSGVLFDDLTALHQNGLANGVLDRLAARTDTNTGLEVDDFFVTLIDRANDDAVCGSAVFLGNDDVLRRVHQLTGEVAGVSGLQRRIGQTLTG